MRELILVNKATRCSIVFNHMNVMYLIIWVDSGQRTVKRKTEGGIMDCGFLPYPPTITPYLLVI